MMMKGGHQGKKGSAAFVILISAANLTNPPSSHSLQRGYGYGSMMWIGRHRVGTLPTAIIGLPR